MAKAVSVAGRVVNLFATGWVRARRLGVALTHPLGRRALRHRVLPSAVHERVLRRVRPTIVLDVGANRGQFALDVLRVAPGARVVAFEPLLDEAAVFDAVLGERADVRLDRRGLWSSTGTVEMHVSAAVDSSSMLAISDLQATTFPGTASARRELVDVVRLDEVLGPDDLAGTTLLKIDVQGGELEVLLGAGDLLDVIDWVYVELSLAEFYVGQPLASDVVTFLHRRGFELVDVGSVTRHRGATVQLDGLFERRARDSPRT